MHFTRCRHAQRLQEWFDFKILVDADACPVKSRVVRIAKERKVPVIMVCDLAHEMDDGYSKIVVVDTGRDSADFALRSRVVPGDIVVTQDYGLAALALAKGARALNQNGLIYDDANIEGLLAERSFSAKIRRAGGRMKGPPKRSAQDDEKFEKSLISLF